jgi:hypothetical protein
MRRRSLTRFFQPIPSMTAMMNWRAWRTWAVSSISRTASVSFKPVELNPLAATAISALPAEGMTRSHGVVRPLNRVPVWQARPGLRAQAQRAGVLSSPPSMLIPVDLPRQLSHFEARCRGSIPQTNRGSGSREGSHLPAPTDPYVNLSIHTALVVLITSRLREPIASARRGGGTVG